MGRETRSESLSAERILSVCPFSLPLIFAAEMLILIFTASFLYKEDISRGFMAFEAFGTFEAKSAGVSWLSSSLSLSLHLYIRTGVQLRIMSDLRLKSPVCKGPSYFFYLKRFEQKCLKRGLQISGQIRKRDSSLYIRSDLVDVARFKRFRVEVS